MSIEKDWTGNKKTAFAALGASNHSEGEREEHDYYATEPFAAEELLRIEPSLDKIWECACGQGHLAEVFAKAGKLGSATDLIDRGYGVGGYNFLDRNWEWDGDIVTNPPYKYAREFIEKALDSVKTGRKVCLFLKLTFLEGKGRKQLFTNTPPRRSGLQALGLIAQKMAILKLMEEIAQRLMLGLYGKKALLATQS